MSHPAHRDLRKLGLYLSASFFLGALIAPWIYNLGKGLEEVTRGKRVNPMVDRLAEWCRVAGFEEFFHVSVVVALVVGAVPFLLWLGVAGRKSVGMGGSEGQPLVPDEQGWQRCLAGFGYASGLFWLIAWLLTTAGSFAWGGTVPGIGGLFLSMLPVAVVLAVVMEGLFRGVVLGIFLRVITPAAAIAGAAVVFALVLFLLPDAGTRLPGSPEAPRAGFALLGLLGARLLDPLAVASGFAPLLVIGLILGYARWRTRSLWLPIGLHAGWSFAGRIFERVSEPVPQPTSLARLLAGESPHQGLLPLAILVVAALMFHFLTPDNA